MSCSCPDWADMCKHVAATLYGVGARLDHEPDLLFTLRGVDRGELVSTGTDLSITEVAADSERVLADADMAALFGVTIETAPPEAKKPVAKKALTKKSDGLKKAGAPVKKAGASVLPNVAKKGAAKTARTSKPTSNPAPARQSTSTRNMGKKTSKRTGS